LARSVPDCFCFPLFFHFLSEERERKKKRARKKTTPGTDQMFQIVFVSPFSFTFFPKREREKKRARKKTTPGTDQMCPKESRLHTRWYPHTPLSPPWSRRAFRVASKGRKDSTPRKSLRALCVDPQETLTLPPPEPLSCFEALFWGLCPWRVFLLRSRLIFSGKEEERRFENFLFFLPFEKEEDDRKNTPKTIFEQSRARCGVRKRSSRLLRL
jgi:hypothetical protein